MLHQFYSKFVIGFTVWVMMVVLGCGGGGSPAVKTDLGTLPDALGDAPSSKDGDVTGGGDVSTDGEVSVDIAGNHAPKATAQEVTCTEDTPCDIVLAGTDEDGDTLSFIVTVQPSHGTLTGIDADGKVLDPQKGVTYTPEADYNGQDNFQFVADDGKEKSSAALVTKSS